MQVVHGRLDAPLFVDSTLEVCGTAAGPLRVGPTGVLVLRGVCEGDVVLDVHARAEIWGIVRGNLINRGGELCVFGIVEGYVQRTSGKTAVSADSIVRKGYRS